MHSHLSEFHAAWAASPFRSVFAGVPPSAPMPPIGAAVILDDGAEADPESVRLWADMTDEAAAAGACFVLLASDRGTRDRAKAALAAELARRAKALRARCGRRADA